MSPTGNSSAYGATLATAASATLGSSPEQQRTVAELRRGRLAISPPGCRPRQVGVGKGFPLKLRFSAPMNRRRSPHALILPVQRGAQTNLALAAVATGSGEDIWTR